MRMEKIMMEKIMVDEELLDIVIPISEKNINIIQMTVTFLQKNIKYRKILIVGNSNLKHIIEPLVLCRMKDTDNIKFVDEDELVPELTLSKIKNIMKCITGDSRRTGWYYQQFLKMAYSYVCTQTYYLVWDADTIPLTPISFFDEGKPLFTMKIEYHKPYFETISRLFPGGNIKHGGESFIAEHMVINCGFMREMIEAIESNTNLQGEKFYEKILFAVDKNEIKHSGFSEFETYGNYVRFKHDKVYTLRRLRTWREAVYILGHCPSINQLIWAGKSFDIISIEYTQKENDSKLAHLTKNRVVRQLFSMKFIVRCKILYNQILKKEGMVFDRL